ncbi:hypothetical protein [Candidatus Methylacidithermus pantelleriae]|uniref:Uncharacterized protein n=1 Tax=Candidatus Methylacidithermus pantelleriae TaxID=2744239 RepID=A0A8J2FRF2_9BACT|nr:hypothetical protein [Candidatus Methylacidithermus pantelleriae]CAF0699947.1 hypothetical protein MPNT_310020 [Candidatus Methylacidithermus pantelleriae]
MAGRRLELESLAPVRTRSLSSFPYAKAIAIAQSRLFFRTAVEVIQFDLALASVMGAVNYARRHGTGFLPRRRIVPSPGEDGFFAHTHSCERR